MYTIHGLFGLVSAELLLMEEIMHQLSLAVLSHYLQGFIHPW